MKKLNCDFLQIIIEFKEEHFNRKDFILDVNPEAKNQTLFHFSFGSKNKRQKEHAHMLLDLDGEESSLRLTYVPEKTETEDVREPDMEDVASWIANFFTTDLVAYVLVVFKFSHEYESVVQLNYPLLVSNELLQGTKVTGHDIDFPEDSLISRGSINFSETGLLILLNTKIEIDLANFNIYRAVEKFSQYANALVKNKENKDAGAKAKN